MIDVNGKKIIPRSDSADPAFLLKEICFFLKFFETGQSDPQALILAKKVHAFLKAGGNDSESAAARLALEAHSEHTRSFDFLWELIYIRRILADLTENSPQGKMEKTRHREKIAELFTRAAEVSPTNYNRCAAVIEWVNASVFSNASGEKEKTDQFLSRALLLFEAMEESKTEKYYTAGQFLYHQMILKQSDLKAPNDNRFHAFQKIIKYAQALYGIKPNDESLWLLAAAYCDSFSYRLFSFEKEKENLKLVLAMLDERIPKGSADLKKIRNALFEKIKKAEQG